MYLKRIFVNLLRISLIVLLFCPANATMKRVHKFKKVNIPWNLIYKDSVIEKGKYDLEILKHHAQATFYLRIMKKSKILCFFSGEYLTYKTYGSEQLRDPNIPDKPTLRMKRNLAEKMVNIIFESGKKSISYPFIKIRFKIGYED